MRVNASGISINYQVDGPEGAPWLILSNSLLTDLSMWDDQATYVHGLVEFLDAVDHGASRVAL